jgi:23S rRNA (cytosine1962-C5)-methyltransferase
MNITAITPQNWTEYELIDSGNFQKLERFGTLITARPEPQALWRPALSENVWQQKADAIFKKEKGNSEKGEWITKRNTPQHWKINYPITPKEKLTFNLSLSSFKHVGIFPEQADNWDFIYTQTQRIKATQPVRLLNLFAYTGGASLAAAQAGATVTHVDSVKSTVNWANDNAKNNGFSNIRWIVEDTLKFATREVRRGNQYEGIILDPPAYGRGANGEKWVLEEQIYELLQLCQQLLHPTHHFLVLNLYSLNFSPLIAESLLNDIFDFPKNLATNELYFTDRAERKLPLGIFARFYH